MLHAHKYTLLEFTVHDDSTDCWRLLRMQNRDMSFKKSVGKDWLKIRGNLLICILSKRDMRRLKQLSCLSIKKEYLTFERRNSAFSLLQMKS